MRVKVYALGLFLCIGASGLAQVTVGGKGGINFNSFIGNKRYDVVPGFNVGGFAKYQVLDFLNVRAELLYSQQGGNLLDYEVLAPELRHSQAKLIFHNVQLPVIAELGLPSLKDERLQPKLLLGGYYSYAVSVRERFVNVVNVKGYPTIEYKGSSNVSEDYYRGQYGVLLGLAAEVDIFGLPVALEFRYQQGLNSVNRPLSRDKYNVKNTITEWGDDLDIATLSFNVAVTLAQF